MAFFGDLGSLDLGEWQFLGFRLLRSRGVARVEALTTLEEWQFRGLGSDRNQWIWEVQAVSPTKRVPRIMVV